MEGVHRGELQPTLTQTAYCQNLIGHNALNLEEKENLIANSSTENILRAAVNCTVQMQQKLS